MGSIVSCAACSALQCCVGAACNCCGRVVPCKSSVVTRAVYAVIFLLTSVAAWVLSNWGFDLLKYVPELASCNGNTFCYGVFSVYRITFALCGWHLLLGILLIGVKSATDCRFFIQGGSILTWAFKVVIWLGGMIGCFFAPNIMFYYFAWISVFGSCLFLLIQIILLIEFAYEWNESWVQKWHGDGIEENRLWFRLLLGITILLLLGTVALHVVMYIFFTRGPVDCGLNIFYITFNLILVIICCVCAVLPRVQEWNPRSGLLQAAVVSLYSTWLVWSAINSEPPGGCNSLTGNQTANQATIIMGAVFTLISVCYSTVRAGSSTEDTLRGTTAVTSSGSSPDSERPLLTVPAEKKDVESGSSDETDDDAVNAEAVSYNYTFFHITFALGAMYIGMLMTNWVVFGGTGTTASIDSGYASVWVKIVTGWLTNLIFLWTVFAPKILSNRSFD